MGILLTCPHCGAREYHEFWFGGEQRQPPEHPNRETVQANYERVWLRANTRGPQTERWFHFAGCRRWIAVERDTQTNEVRQTGPGGG